jgi:hypothetical protein
MPSCSWGRRLNPSSASNRFLGLLISSAALFQFNACNDWDEGDDLLVNDADVYIRISCQGREVYNSRDWAVANTNCAAGCVFPSLLAINQLAAPHLLEIYDADDEGADQLIGSAEFIPWQALSGWKFPTHRMLLHLPQNCTRGLFTNHIAVSLAFEGIFYSF